MRDIAPQRLIDALRAAKEALAALPPDAADDHQLIVDTIEGESEALELMDRLAEQVIADEALIGLGAERAKRLQQRADRRRDVLQRMMQALDLDGALERPFYTAAISHRQHVIVTDAGKLKSTYLKQSPDVRLIGSLLRGGQRIEGAVLSNPEPSLTIRTR